MCAWKMCECIINFFSFSRLQARGDEALISAVGGPIRPQARYDVLYTFYNNFFFYFLIFYLYILIHRLYIALVLFT